MSCETEKSEKKGMKMNLRKTLPCINNHRASPRIMTKWDNMIIGGLGGGGGKGAGKGRCGLNPLRRRLAICQFRLSVRRQERPRLAADDAHMYE